ncbi:hypothetical protein M3212_12740 [Alkalihalobacillus oceani]|uniref:hypothetical protein n=1 Tax=Halalkalibacter oceani TaxID=1653776 RepID=UPI00203EA37C|nr:hypothetical protein [Halalkalibacter oceani]MCM3761655.1 hypothetical protein [Halalkalibacter oceani]
MFRGKKRLYIGLAFIVILVALIGFREIRTPEQGMMAAEMERETKEAVAVQEDPVVNDGLSEQAVERELPDFEEIFAEESLSELREKMKARIGEQRTYLETIVQQTDSDHWLELLETSEWRLFQRSVNELFYRKQVPFELMNDMEKIVVLSRITYVFQEKTALTYLYQLVHDLDVHVNRLTDPPYGVTEAYGSKQKYMEIDQYLQVLARSDSFG